MNLPDCKVVTRTDWTKLRDKSGGKKGLTKVSMGDALDDFHSKVAKAESYDDVYKRIEKLEETATSYLKDIKKAKEYSELEKVVTDKIVEPIQNFAKAVKEQQESDLEKIRESFRVPISTAENTISTQKKIVDVLKIELQKLTDKYQNGVPVEEKKDLIETIKKYAMKLDETKKAVDQVGADILGLSKQKRAHEEIAQEFNSVLQDLGKSIKTLNEVLRFDQGKIKELAIYIKG